MLEVGNLLLNFLFILVTVLFLFAQDIYYHRKKEWIIGMAGSTAVVFCMSFPFTVFPGLFFDLRIIPILIAVLYGNVHAGIMVSAVLLAYRFVIGGDGFFLTVISYIPLNVFLIWVMRKWKSISVIRLGTVMAAAMSSLVVAVVFVNGHAGTVQQMSFFVQYIIVVTLCMWITVYVAETFRENRRMREEMQQKEKLEVISELAATMAHEIRNPITVTKGFLQLMDTRIVDKRMRAYTRHALREINRAEEVISYYLMYAKPEASKVERLNVKELLTKICSEMERYVQSYGHQIDVQLKDKLHICADAKQFSRLIVSFIKNATEAIERDGRIFIEAYADGTNVVIEITDNGIGMNEEQLARLGEPFYSTKTKGTGLGLMMSYRIINMLNGRIDVESKEGVGTKFTIILPSST